MSLLRVPRLVLAVNKIDLVDYDEATFLTIAKEFHEIAEVLGYGDDAVVAIPVSALEGDNVVELSARTPWYDGPALLAALDAAEPAGQAPLPFRMPVQNVIREGGRFYAGTVASGRVRPGVPLPPFWNALR